MIIDMFIAIFVWLITAILFILQPVMNFAFSLGVDVASWAGYVFGNIMLFNSFLPVAEFFVLAGSALAFKLAIFGWQVVMFLFGFLGQVKRVFIHWRV